MGHSRVRLPARDSRHLCQPCPKALGVVPLIPLVADGGGDCCLRAGDQKARVLGTGFLPLSGQGDHSSELIGRKPSAPGVQAGISPGEKPSVNKRSGILGELL